MSSNQVRKVQSNNTLSSSVSNGNLSGFSTYLNQFKMTEKDEKRPYTNTRIGCVSLNIHGGSYHIPDGEYEAFLTKYYDEIIAKSKQEYLTECQLPDGGALLVDFDLRFPITTTERKYTQEHIGDLVDLYLEVMKTMYQFDEDTQFNVYVMEKPTINRDETKQVTKDGIHLIFGISCERRAQIWLRKTVISKLNETSWEELAKGGEAGQTNSWDDVLDEGITNGGTNWQLYGSCKPNYDSYRLTTIYKIGFENDEFTIIPTPVKGNANIIRDHFVKLSARHKDHPQFFYTSSFLTTMEEWTQENTRATAASRHDNRGGVGAVKYADFVRNNDVLMVSSHDQLRELLNNFLDLIEPYEYIQLRETYEYVMVLPPEFYEAGSYTKWINVGFALRNTDDRLFIVWVVFSAQASNFQFSWVRDMYDKWQRFDVNNPDGLTKRSIMHWAKENNRLKYNEIRLNSVDFKIDQMLGKLEDLSSGGGGKKKERYGCGDFDIAEILYHLKKGEYVCVSVKSSIWYMYIEPRWMEIDSGTTLRKSLSTELRNIMANKATKYMEERSRLNDANDADRINVLTSYIDKLLNISQRLANTQDKKNIMTEAKELFYDGTFLQKLDNNPYLLCFNNGVVDFKTHVFRRGVPEDYLSKCTNIDYIPIDKSRDAQIVHEIEQFMKQLFPVQELHDYMWEHLASTLIGTAMNQTFNMYIGHGQNGKSVLVSLMEMILGDYKGDVPLSLLTDRRTKIGGLSPELVALKGVRYAVMQEPRKGDCINEGVMKQLTSGIDPIQARAPYMPSMLTFIPQFKLVVCSNEFMEIKSQDHGTWRRIRVVEFMSLFTENPVTTDAEKPHQFKLDLELKDTKFPLWKHTFVSMLVEKAFQTNGKVVDCPMVVSASQSYRVRQDVIAEFISEKIQTNPAGVITNTELCGVFTDWHKMSYGRNCPSMKDVQAHMDKKFKKGNGVGKTWIGVSIIYEANMTTYGQGSVGEYEDEELVDENDIQHVDAGEF